MAEVPASSQYRIIRYVMRMNCQGGRGPREQRYRVGESHARSTIPDAIVDQIRAHHDAGMGWRRIWQLLHEQGVKIGRYTVRRICRYETRSQIAQIVVEVRPS